MSSARHSPEDWRPLFSRLVEPSRQGDEGFHKKPTDADLDRFEAESGVRLPAGDRDFIKVFGPGEIGGVCRVSSPGSEYRAIDLADFNRSMGGPRLESVFRLVPQPRRRLLLFADSWGSDLFGWDLDDVTDLDAPEYGVYCRSRDIGVFMRAAGTFWEFVNDFLLDSEAICNILDTLEEGLPTMTFSRILQE